MAAVAERVKKIIMEELGREESELTNDASFINDLGADSLDTVTLIMKFEEEFKVTIEDSDAEKIQTVGDAIRYLESKAK